MKNITLFMIIIAVNCYYIIIDPMDCGDEYFDDEYSAYGFKNYAACHVSVHNNLKKLEKFDIHHMSIKTNHRAMFIEHVIDFINSDKDLFSTFGEKCESFMESTGYPLSINIKNTHKKQIIIIRAINNACIRDRDDGKEEIIKFHKIHSGSSLTGMEK